VRFRSLQASIGAWFVSTGVSFAPTGMRREHQKNRPNEPEDHALGRSRGGFGTKIHLVCDRLGKPAGAVLSAGQDHESKYFESAMESACGVDKDGSLRHKPGAISGDKAYSSTAIREWMAERKIQDVVPTKSNEPRREEFDRELYRGRNVVERCLGWLKERRRIATRFEKLAVHYLAMLQLAMILSLM
jgi:transposase